MSAPTIGEEWKQELLALPSGWDSYGGNKITEAAVATVESFLVVPCSNGGVQLEIHRDGYDIEIEIGPAGDIGGAFICHEKAKCAD